MIEIKQILIVTRFMTKRTLVLAALLAALWLLLSGYFKPLLLGLGAVSIGLVMIIAARMDVVDHEGHPYHHLRSTKILQYWGWLIVEITKSNLDVAKRIMLGSSAISPIMLRVPTTQATEVARVIYANSITLTPGTVSVDVADDYIEVHALTEATANALRAGEMDRRITDLEEID